ncbi:MAG: SDR family oxidoreductase [Proteobacteria bacterium]|nr:SDR family oxidoreductase [Pseudomonadota bacterium]
MRTGWLAISVTTVLLSLQAVLPVSAATVLITGANRGIGLEFAKEYAALGWTVIATYRGQDLPGSLAELARQHPERVLAARMDVTDLGEIDRLAQQYRGKPIDVLINNAAIVGDLRDARPQQFGSLDHELFNTFMQTNVRGPLKVSEAFLENVASSERKVIVVISSLAGSFGAAAQNLPGRVYYKTSKAAVNMAMTSMAVATQARGITVVSIHPGGVKVEKLQDFDVPGFMQPEESVSSMIRVIGELQPSQTGSFLNFDGKVLPW